jgi:hypothetical protein
MLIRRLKSDFPFSSISADLLGSGYLLHAHPKEVGVGGENGK